MGRSANYYPRNFICNMAAGIRTGAMALLFFLALFLYMLEDEVANRGYNKNKV